MVEELFLKVCGLDDGEAAKQATVALRRIGGVGGVEVDPTSGWLVTRGHGIRKQEVIQALLRQGLVIERVSHDFDPEVDA